MLQQQAEMQYRYYNELERKYERGRRLNHDIKNHLVILENLYNENYDDATLYSKELKEELDESNIQFKTTSKVLNILLAHNLELIKNFNVEFDFSCEEIDFSFISDFDLSILFSNLLDNAIEECISNNLDKNFIDLRICQINNFVVILLVNSSEKKVKNKKDKFISKKDGHMGLGLTNINRIVEKYNGDINIDYMQNKFSVQVTFGGIERDFNLL